MNYLVSLVNVWSLGTLGFVALSAIFSIGEGTFLRRQWRHMHMAFVHNWAVSIGDTFIFSTLNGLLMPSLWTRLWGPEIFICIMVGLIITNIVHSSWWGNDENLGHVYYEWKKGGAVKEDYSRDLAWAGLVHFIFMAMQLAVSLAYIFSWEGNKNKIVLVGILFCIFLVIQNIQAKVIQEPTLDWDDVVKNTLMQFAGVFFITGLKLYLA